MFYILHGDNEFQRGEALRALIEKTDIPADFRDLNTEVLEGPVPVGELRRACSVIPFLGGGRLVIAHNLLTKTKSVFAKEVVAYLENLPETTHLIFVESKTLPRRNAVLVLAEKLKVPLKCLTLPNARALPGWIQNRAKDYDVQIESRAAAVLAQNLGANLRLLDQELQKLRLYVGESPTITFKDVQVMVPYVQSADVIFKMVDALGQRDPRKAANFLHRLLNVGEHPLGIFGMIVRQFRLLIQVRWLVDHNHAFEKDVATRLKLHPFVAKKILAQASHFTFKQLHDAYRLLQESDIAIKRGLLTADTALDLLVAELTAL